MGVRNPACVWYNTAYGNDATNVNRQAPVVAAARDGRKRGVGRSICL